MVQDYSSKNTFTWTPGPFDGGSYNLQVWVRSAGSPAPFQAWRAWNDFVIVGAPAVAVTSFTPNVSFPSPVLAPITWTATATGGVNATPQGFVIDNLGNFAAGEWTLRPSSANTAISKDEWARYFVELYLFVAVVFLFLTTTLAALERRLVGRPGRDAL